MVRLTNVAKQMYKYVHVARKEFISSDRYHEI